MALPLVPIVAVVLVLAAFVLMGRRFPVLFRMGLRNALRRKTQTLVVIGGLMVGTAIISGSLASGDSLSHGIRQGAFEGLGPADVFVQLEGQLHFPRVLYDDLNTNASVRNVAVALSPILYEEAALLNPASRQSEPRVSFIGFDPTANRPFGTFRTSEGAEVDGSELGARDVYVTRELAERLEVRAGDTVTVNYAEPPVPLVPRLFPFNGTLTVSAGACPIEPVCGYVAPPGQPAIFSIPVAPGAVSITTIVGWPQGATPVDLDQLVRAPDGTTYANGDGTPATPDNPSVLNVTATDGIVAGNWTFEVTSKVAANQPFRAIALVFYNEYNLSALQDFAREAEAAGFSAEDFTGGGEQAELRSTNLTVRHVVEKSGFGDFLLGQNVFARLETVGAMYGVPDSLNIILASGDPDPEKGAGRTEALLAVLPDAVNASAALHPESAAIGQAQVVPVKMRWLDGADRAGNLFKEFLTTIGSFTVLAGIMLIINIFVMLAEERKSELGMARAVGLTRRQLILLFAFEGLLYALVASLIGVVLGLGIAYGLIYGLNNLFATGNDPDSLISFPFHVEAASMVWAFAAGFLITLVTVGIASWKVSRLNVVRAIRRIEDPPRKATRATFLIGITLAILGFVGTSYGFLLDQFVLKVLSPSVLIMGVGMIASRWVPRKFAYPTAGAGVATYSAWSLFTLGNPDGLVNRIMGPLRGVLIVLAVVLIIVYIPQIVRLTRRLLLKFKTLVPAVKPGVAYPLEKRTRTGLTITMFALVILVVVAFSIFTATFTIDLEAQSGGYQVEADTTIPLSDLRTWYAQNGDPTLADPFARVESYDALSYALVFGGRTIKIEGEAINYQGPPVDYVYAYSSSFARNNAFALDTRAPEYATDTAAYEAVLTDPSLVIISTVYNFDEAGQPGRHAVGDNLTMETATGATTFRIVGIQKQFYLGGVFVAPEVIENNFQRIRGEYLFRLLPDEDPRVAAQEIEAAFQEAGMNAVSIKEEAAKQLEQNRRFLTLFQLFLGFGLVVGIASLGIVTARAVIERRQEIGMLRAIGYPANQILKIFYIEIFFTTALGVIVGTSIGILLTYGVVSTTASLDALGINFTVPWWNIIKIIGLTFVAVFFATLYPALRASRIPPAEAVRYIE